MRFLRDNGLTLALMAAFLVSLIGMMLSGWADQNSELARHSQPSIGFGAYVVSGSFLTALFENWESEFLQMAAYVTFTAYLFQRGSAESNDPDDPDRPRDELPKAWSDRSPVLGWLYSHSLGTALALLFVLSFVAHWLSSVSAANQEAAAHGVPPLSSFEYLADARFWFESFQNWQSEFLSTAVLVVLSIFMRFKGSPDSKPVAAPHSETGA